MGDNGTKRRQNQKWWGGKTPCRRRLAKQLIDYQERFCSICIIWTEITPAIKKET
jgi:hypothetical protein